MTGKYGLGCDNVVAMRVVLASGDLVTCTAEEEPELFWSIRGGSSNFGVRSSSLESCARLTRLVQIVVEFTINAFPHPGPAMSGVLIYAAEQERAVHEAAKHFIQRRRPEQSLVYMFGRNPHTGAANVLVPPYFPCKFKDEVAVDSATGGFFDAKVCCALPLVAPFAHAQRQPIADLTYIAPGFDEVCLPALIGGVVLKSAHRSPTGRTPSSYRGLAGSAPPMCSSKSPCSSMTTRCRAPSRHLGASPTTFPAVK
jgi:hypothetical protein